MLYLPQFFSGRTVLIGLKLKKHYKNPFSMTFLIKISSCVHGTQHFKRNYNQVFVLETENLSELMLKIDVKLIQNE